MPDSLRKRFTSQQLQYLDEANSTSYTSFDLNERWASDTVCTLTMHGCCLLPTICMCPAQAIFFPFPRHVSAQGGLFMAL